MRAILVAWDPLGDSPEDEYDCLVDHIVSELHNGQTQEHDIATVISSELQQHFGVTASAEGTVKVAGQIAAYWRSLKS